MSPALLSDEERLAANYMGGIRAGRFGISIVYVVGGAFALLGACL